MPARRRPVWIHAAARTVCAAFLCVLLAACNGDAPPTRTPPPTQPLNPAPPTATPVPVVPTATLTFPPSAADVARTATGQAPTPDATEQTRQSQGRLALETVSRAENVPVSALELISVTGVRAGREIEGCGRARSGMVLAYVLRGETASELLIEGGEATVCATANIYDGRPDLFLLIDPIAADLTELALQRAARSAGVEVSEVVVVSVRPMTWPDGTLGCAPIEATPEPSASGGVAGYAIVLAVGETRYVYHTDFDRIVPCVTA